MKKRKKIVVGCVWVIGILIGFVVILEILSRTCHCSTPMYSESMPTCDKHLYADDANVKNYLNELSGKYKQGISPTPEELEKAVIKVTRDSIGGANGMYCNGVAFVSNDLPMQAELYVRRHELEHAFQYVLQMEVANPESAANYTAAKEYPIGMIETVIVSIMKGKSHFSSTTCYLIALWETFKRYFLPLAG